MSTDVEFQFRPIDEWPGALTHPSDRQRSRFDSTYTDTLDLLRREVGYIIKRQGNVKWREPTGPVIFALAMDESRITVDRSRPKANANPDHPGVILAFSSVHGPLRYATDTFTKWQDNLRAIALGLEALRKVDRYGITKRGEQYRGFAALPAGGPSGPTSIEEAVKLLARVADIENIDHAFYLANRESIHRAAKRAAHPDAGGSQELFVDVTRAIDFLKENVR